jgi:energy-coupling factor transporter ATP-binding protein EcfA2
VLQARAVSTARTAASLEEPAADYPHRRAVSVQGLCIAFGPANNRKQVLSGIDLEVKQGSFHILLGPNGCGKSTLLKTLGGLVKPDTGRLDVDGPVGFVFQDPDHQVVMPTVLADVTFGLGRYQLPEELVMVQAQHALELVSMQAYGDRATHTLSGGQKQRVAIAGALAERPRVLLLDELTTFLDSEDQEGVLRAVRDITHGDEGITALWVTHRLEELQWADTASYMDEGRIQFSGPAKDVAAYMRRLGART